MTILEAMARAHIKTEKEHRITTTGPGWTCELRTKDGALIFTGPFETCRLKLAEISTCAALRAAMEHESRLRNAVIHAEHAPDCASLRRVFMTGGLCALGDISGGPKAHPYPCNCWKRDALEGT